MGRKKIYKNYYPIYQNDFVECVFCKKNQNIWNVKSHLKKCKSCVKLQELIDGEIYKEMYINFIRDINTLREQIKEDLKTTAN